MGNDGTSCVVQRYCKQNPLIVLPPRIFQYTVRSDKPANVTRRASTFLRHDAYASVFGAEVTVRV